MFGGNYLSYSYLAQPFFIFGQPYGLNRIAAFLAAAGLCIALYYFLHATRIGRALRAVAIDPTAAAIVGVDVVSASALAFALGGAVAPPAAPCSASFSPLTHRSGSSSR